MYVCFFATSSYLDTKFGLGVWLLWIVNMPCGGTSENSSIFRILVYMLIHCWDDPIFEVLLIYILSAAPVLWWGKCSHTTTIFTDNYYCSYCICDEIYSVLLHIPFYCIDSHVKMFMDSTVLVRKGITFYQDLLGFTTAWFFMICWNQGAWFVLELAVRQWMHFVR